MQVSILSTSVLDEGVIMAYFLEDAIQQMDPEEIG